MCILMLTNSLAGNYAESLKLIARLSHPSDLRFFCNTYGQSIAGNTLNTGRAFVISFSEAAHTHFFVGLLKRITKMTTLNGVYGVYVKLRQIFSGYNPKNHDKDTKEANTALCGALCELESAMAYIGIEDRSDRKLKLKLLKQSLSLATERADGTIDWDNLPADAREQLTMVLQLIKG